MVVMALLPGDGPDRAVTFRHRNDTVGDESGRPHHNFRKYANEHPEQSSRRKPPRADGDTATATPEYRAQPPAIGHRIQGGHTCDASGTPRY
ncbi:hypothetical protein TPA0907_24920 [Micromonospora humidisoli]|nr:hypothetical protein TPA0907_24920 [Micromonospora sp. AKA109]